VAKKRKEIALSKITNRFLICKNSFCSEIEFCTTGGSTSLYFVVVLHFIFAQQHSVCCDASFLQQDDTFLDNLQVFILHEIAACVPKLSIKDIVNMNLNNFIIFLFITYTNQ